MAYVSQEKKAELAPAIKKICKRYGVKGSISVRNNSTLVLTVQSGCIDFIGMFNQIASEKAQNQNEPFHPAKDHISVNTYWQHYQFSGVSLDFLNEVNQAMRGADFFDDSDSQTDYFHCSHYIEINIGRWNKPYKYEQVDTLIAA